MLAMFCRASPFRSMPGGQTGAVARQLGPQHHLAFRLCLSYHDHDCVLEGGVPGQIRCELSVHVLHYSWRWDANTPGGHRNVARTWVMCRRGRKDALLKCHFRPRAVATGPCQKPCQRHVGGGAGSSTASLGSFNVPSRCSRFRIAFLGCVRRLHASHTPGSARLRPGSRCRSTVAAARKVEARSCAASCLGLAEHTRRVFRLWSIARLLLGICSDLNFCVLRLSGLLLPLPILASGTCRQDMLRKVHREVFRERLRPPYFCIGMLIEVNAAAHHKVIEPVSLLYLHAAGFYEYYETAQGVARLPILDWQQQPWLEEGALSGSEPSNAFLQIIATERFACGLPGRGSGWMRSAHPRAPQRDLNHNRPGSQLHNHPGSPGPRKKSTRISNARRSSPPGQRKSSTSSTRSLGSPTGRRKSSTKNLGSPAGRRKSTSRTQPLDLGQTKKSSPRTSKSSRMSSCGVLLLALALLAHRHLGI